MQQFINNIMNSASKYTVWDFAFFKTALLTLGILIGAQFSKLFKKLAPLLWIIYILCYIWIAYKTFVEYWED